MPRGILTPLGPVVTGVRQSVRALFCASRGSSTPLEEIGLELEPMSGGCRKSSDTSAAFSTSRGLVSDGAFEQIDHKKAWIGRLA